MDPNLSNALSFIIDVSISLLLVQSLKKSDLRLDLSESLSKLDLGKKYFVILLMLYEEALGSLNCSLVLSLIEILSSFLSFSVINN